MVPLSLATYVVNSPKDIQFIDHIDFYVFLEKEKRKCYQPLWTNFNLLTQGRTIQIWGPSNWKIRVTFDGEEHTIREEDVFEKNPCERDPRVFRYYDYKAMEDNNEEENNGDNIEEDELYQEENGLHYNDEDDYENDAEENDEDDYATDSQNEGEQIVPCTPRRYRQGM